MIGYLPDHIPLYAIFERKLRIWEDTFTIQEKRMDNDCKQCLMRPAQQLLQEILLYLGRYDFQALFNRQS